MKIVILSESYTLEPVMDDLKKLGDLAIYEDTTTKELMIERCQGADVALLNCWISPLDHDVLDGLTSVRLIVTNTTGYDQIDVAYARGKGIAVANVPGFGTESVAELAIGLMLAVNRMIPLGDRMMHNKPFWIEPQSQDQQVFHGHNMNAMTMGIVGLGAIGSRVAEMAQSLGMKVIGYNRMLKEISGVGLLPLDEVFKQADVISINVASTPETKNIVNEHTLSLMKPDAILINTARDNNVDVEALYQALANKKIRGAGLDGIGLDSDNHPILKLDSLVMTPHIGWHTVEAELNIAHIVRDNVAAFANGQAKNVVN